MHADFESLRSDYESPHSDSDVERTSDAAQVESDEDHSSQEDIDNNLCGGNSQQSERIVELSDSDSEPLPVPCRRPVNGLSSRRRTVDNPHQRRRSTILPRTSNTLNHSTISVDNDSDDFTVPAQRPSRRPRARRQISSDEDEIPRFLPSSTNERSASDRMTPPARPSDSRQQMQSSNHCATHNPRESSATTPILIDSTPVRRISVPGAFHNSFSHSEPSQVSTCSAFLLA